MQDNGPRQSWRSAGASGACPAGQEGHVPVRLNFSAVALQSAHAGYMPGFAMGKLRLVAVFRTYLRRKYHYF